MPGRQNQAYDIGNYYVGFLTINQSASGTLVTPDQLNPTGSGMNLAVDITVITTATVTVTVQGKDELSGKYYTLLATTALAAVATTAIQIFPGAVVTANVSANAMLPNTYRIQAVLGGAATQVNATIGGSIGIM